MDTAPEFLTLGQAARACNRSKATISRAVRSGRLPAKAAADNAGGWLIRRDDLDRVFPPQPGETVTRRLRSTARGEAEAIDNRHEMGRLRVDVERLRERLQTAEQRLVEKDGQIADLREDRDRWREQATRLLPAPPEPRRSWWRRFRK